MTPCYPSRHMPSCERCARRRCGHPREDRVAVVIDAAAIARNGVCAMFEPRLPRAGAAARVKAFNDQPRKAA